MSLKSDCDATLHRRVPRVHQKRSAVAFLATFAPKTAPIALAEIGFVEGDMAARADLLRMRQPVLLEGEFLFPGEEVEAVLARFLDQRAQLGGRQGARGELRRVRVSVAAGGWAFVPAMVLR